MNAKRAASKSRGCGPRRRRSGSSGRDTAQRIVSRRRRRKRGFSLSLRCCLIVSTSGYRRRFDVGRPRAAPAASAPEGGSSLALGEGPTGRRLSCFGTFPCECTPSPRLLSLFGPASQQEPRAAPGQQLRQENLGQPGTGALGSFGGPLTFQQAAAQPLLPIMSCPPLPPLAFLDP